MLGNTDLEYLTIKDIIPYDKNPRDNSTAIDAVKNSIAEFGFLIPCVIDADNILVAGHTRYAAAQLLKIKTIPCIRVTKLSKAQVDAFRIIDNKTSELASWDMELLAQELDILTGSGMDFIPFGFGQEEIDCLSAFMSDEDMEEDGVDTAFLQKKKSYTSLDPESVRVSIGELNFFVDRIQYQDWFHEVSKQNKHDSEAIVQDITNRLDINIEIENKKTRNR